MCNLPGVTITAICDNVPEKVAKAQKMLADKVGVAEGQITV